LCRLSYKNLDPDPDPDFSNLDPDKNRPNLPTLHTVKDPCLNAFGNPTIKGWYFAWVPRLGESSVRATGLIGALVEAAVTIGTGVVI
jgi:hypothetical protein